MRPRSPGPGTARGEGTFDREQFKALLIASIKLDLRSSRLSHGRRSKFPPLVAAFITYIVMGTLLAVALVSTADPFLFSLLTLSAAMFMTALLVIMEYSSVVVHPDDFDVLAHRPVSSRTYFWTKIANLAFYVTATSFSLSIPAAVVGGITFDPGVGFGAIYLVVALVACQTTAALVVLIYSVALRVFNYEKFTRAITYVHSLSTLVIVLGYVLLPRVLAEDVTVLSLDRGPWVYGAPPAWFAGAIELATSAGGGGQTAILTLLAAGSAVALIGGAMNTISLDYSRRIAELATTSAKAAEVAGAPRRSFARLGIALCRTDEERAGFELMRRYMTRDRKLRARIYPAYGLPAAVYIYGLITGGLGDPFVRRQIEGNALPAQQLLGFYSVLITLFFATALSQSDQWQASWIFYAAPTRSRAAIVTGARKLIIWRYLAPFYAVLFVLLAFVMPPAKAALYVLLVFLLAMTAFALLSMASAYLPLSQALEKTRQARQIGLVMLLGVAMGLMAAVLEILKVIPAAGFVVFPVLAVLAILAEIALRARLRRRLAGEEFAG